MTNTYALMDWLSKGVEEVPTNNLIELLGQIVDELKHRQEEENG